MEALPSPAPQLLGGSDWPVLEGWNVPLAARFPDVVAQQQK